MKKLTGLVLLALMINFTACQEEAIEATDNAVEQTEKSATFNENVSVQDNMLYFASVEDYENTIAYLWELGDEHFPEWEEKLSFNSMRKMISEEEREKIGIVDDLFATLLNPNGMVYIGEYIFQENLPNETVSVVKYSDYNFTNGNVLSIFNTKNNVRIFSIDDDVFGILNGTATENTKKSKYCKSRDVGPYYWYPANNTGMEIKLKVVYQRGATYRSLQAKIKKQGDLSGDLVEIYLDVYPYTSWYKHKKTNGKKYISEKHIGGTGREYNYRAYGGFGARRLKDYSFKVYFEAEGESGWYKSAALLNTCKK